MLYPVINFIKNQEFGIIGLKDSILSFNTINNSRNLIKNFLNLIKYIEQNIIRTKEAYKKYKLQ